MSENTVVIRISADGQVAKSELASVQRALDGLGKTSGPAAATSGLRNVDTAAGNARRGLAGIGREIDQMRSGLVGLAQLAGLTVLARSAASFYREAAGAGIQAEKLANTLHFASGSAEETAANQAFLSSTVRTLGLDAASSGAAFAGLAAAARGTALEGQGARSIFDAVAKASTVMGLSVEQTDGALLALQQMISKGTVSAEELRGQLGERLPGAFQIAARAMGVTTGELGKMLEQGNLATDVFLPRFAAQIRVEMGGAVESAADSVQANLNRVGNAWQTLLTTVNSSSFNAQSLKGLELALASASRVLSTSASDWQGWGDTVARVLAYVADTAGGALIGPRAVVTQVTATLASAKAQAERLLSLGADVAKTGGKNRASIEAEFAGRTQAIQSGYANDMAAIVKGGRAFSQALAAEQTDRSKAAAAGAELTARDAQRRFEADQRLLASKPPRGAPTAGKDSRTAAQQESEYQRMVRETLANRAPRLADVEAKGYEAANRAAEANMAAEVAATRKRNDDVAALQLDLVAQTKQVNVGLIADDRARGLAQIDIERTTQQVRLDAWKAAGADIQSAQDALNEYVLARQAELTEQLKPQWQRTVEGWADKNRLMRESWDTTMGHMIQGGEDAWVQFMTTGKANVSDLVKTVLADLARVQFRDSIAPAFASASKSVLGAFLPQPAADPASSSSKTEKAGEALGASAAGLDEAAKAFGNPIQALMGAGQSLVQSALGWLLPQAAQTTSAVTMGGAATALLGAAGALTAAAATLSASSVTSLFAANGAVIDGQGWHAAAAFAAGGAFGQGEVLTQPTLFRFRQAGAVRLGLAGEAGAEAALPMRAGGVTASVGGRAAGSIPLTRNGGLLGVDLTDFVTEMQGRAAQRFAVGGAFGAFESPPSPGMRSGSGGNAVVATQDAAPAVVVHQTLVFHGDGVNRTEMVKFGKRIQDQTEAVVMDKIRRGRRST